MAAASTSRRAKSQFKLIGQKEGLVDRVVKAMEDKILRGKLPVGSRLPPEREFAEQLGVSRPVVREAVRILTAQGMLETKHGIGTTVRAVSRDEVVKPIKLLLRVRGDDISVEHLHQVRSILEVEIAGLAAEHGTEEDFRDLSRLCREMADASDDPVLFAVKDSEFHRRLGEASHNPLLIVLLESVHDLMADVRSVVADQQDVYNRVMPTHHQVLESAAAHDVESARSAMQQHLRIALEIQIEAAEKQAVLDAKA
jgi:GntR family transcriptional repressor for pyruvate dehydrogenase complex